MKKIIALLVILSLFVSLISCSDKGNEKEVTTTQAQTTENEIVETTEEETYGEQTTRQMVFVDGETIAFDSGTYRFEIQKTDFESKYPEELLLQFANMLSMSFGVEDYYDWNTTGQNVFRDVQHCTLSISGFMVRKSIAHEQTDEDAVMMFWHDTGLEYIAGDLKTFNLKDYNEFLVDMFGPNVRQFETEDFETGKTAADKGIIPTEGIGEGEFCCYYSGKEDIMIFQICPTGYSCAGEYIYNVENDGEDYYVYTVGTTETFGKITDFNEYQNLALTQNSFLYTGEALQTKKYKFGNADGNVYLRGVDESYLIAENAEYNYYVASDVPAEFKMKKAHTEDYKTVETFNKGEKVLVVFNSETRGICNVITEKGYGIIESKYLKEIE